MMKQESLQHGPSLATKLLVSAWMVAAMTGFILVSVSLAPGNKVATFIPQFLMPLREWLLAMFQAPALY